MMEDELELENVSAGYGDLIVVRDISFAVPRAHTTVLVGRNGAGKTTLLRAICGLNEVVRGDIRLGGQSLTRQPAYRRQKLGVGLVQENKRIFRRRSVEENLKVAAYGARLGRRDTAARISEAYARFPVLADKRHDRAGYLSGGQQQMLAISQALIGQPRVLLLDEPFSGLAPSIVNDVMEAIRRIRSEEGRTVLLVEQAVELALSIADIVLVLDVGRLVHSGRPEDHDIRQIVEGAYFAKKAGEPIASPAQAIASEAAASADAAKSDQ